MAVHIQILTTVNAADKGAALARSIVEARLAAGVKIVGPIRSVYWWQDEIADTQEWQLIMMTTADLFPALKAHIKTHHSYVTPEIIATPIMAGSREYLQWISDETRQSDA